MKSHWNQELPENAIGFVYRITNLINGKIYIGKKLCRTIKKLKPLKGKKRSRKVACETDWKTYTSSSEKLNDDIAALGKENFKFEIITFCESKSALAYIEAYLQFKENVLLNDNYYNGIINLRTSSNSKLSEEVLKYLSDMDGL